MKYLVLVSLFFCLFIKESTAIENVQTSLSSPTSLSIPYVFQSVNVITGDYCETETDLVCPKSMFRLKRTFSNHTGWHFNTHKPLVSIADDFSESFKIVNSESFDEMHINSKDHSIVYRFAKPSICQGESLLLLTHVFLDGQQIYYYEYCPHPTERRHLLSLKEQREGHYLINEYYYGDETQEALIEPKVCRDFIKGKIKTQKAYLSIDENALVTAHFFYYPGYTIVFDSLNQKTIYRYHPDGYLLAIENFQDHKIYRSQEFKWQKDPGNEFPRLVAKVWKDEIGTPLACRYYEYTSDGRLSAEILYGNLSGVNSSPLILENDDRPIENGIESYATRWLYSERHPHLPIMQKEDNGKTIHYEYDPQTRLLKTEYSEINSYIYMKRFFEYDTEGILTRVIIDNGSLENETYIDSVAKRSIQIIQNDQDNFIKHETQELLDPVNNFIEEQIFHYDKNGKTFKSLYKNGITEETSYDQYGNEIFLSFYSQKKELKRIFKKYDKANRLIKVSTIDSKGSISTATHTYNPKGERISTIDDFGNTMFYSYDSLGRLKQKYVLNASDAIGDISTYSKTYKYNIFDQIVEECDSQGNITKFDYNIRGQPIYKCFPDQTSICYEYELDGSLKKQTDIYGNTITTFEGLKKPKVSAKSSLEMVEELTRNDLRNFKELNPQRYLKNNLTSELHKNTNSPTKFITSFSNRYQKNLSYSDYVKNDWDQTAKKFFSIGFLQFAGYFQDAITCDIYNSGHELNDKVRVTLINGILNVRTDIKASAKQLSDAHGGVSIHYVFYPTSGWSRDILSNFFVKMGYISPRAHALAATWKKLIAEMGGSEGGGTIIHYAHSIGGTDTYSAKDLLSPEEQKMIHVTTLGSPSLIPPNVGFASVNNYVSLRDGVCLLDPIGYVKGLFSIHDNVHFLGSPIGIPFVDHMLYTNNYQSILQHLGKEFLRKYGIKN